MSVPLTCHILDTVSGKPAESVVCMVSHLTLNSDNDTAIIESESQFAIAKTNADGRVTQWIFKPDPSERSHLRELGVVETSTGKLEWQS